MPRRKHVDPPTGHAHHMRIEEPSGPTSAGRCEVCGYERRYLNSDVEYMSGAEYEAARANELLGRRPGWQNRRHHAPH